jgi:hypothetical protein
MHELNHAVHGPWILSNSVWEEGMARGAEVAEMNLLAARGVSETASYFDLHHQFSYDEYYEDNNTADVGVQDGSIYGYGDPALVLLRYEQSGYAFGKLLIEGPNTLRRFNAKLFAQPNGNLSVSTLESMLAAVKPNVQGTSFSKWYGNQGIFMTAPPTGCRLYQRVSQYTVDSFSRSSSGAETPQSGVTVTYNVYRASGALLWSGTGTTTDLGWTTFTPQLGGYNGRLKLVASATAPCGTASSTFYRQSGAETGVFGVVKNATSGTVTFSSPRGLFTSFSVPVTNGAIVAPTLRQFPGQVTASFSGSSKTATRTITKDARDYSVVLTAT